MSNWTFARQDLNQVEWKLISILKFSLLLRENIIYAFMKPDVCFSYEYKIVEMHFITLMYKKVYNKAFHK